MRGCCAASDLTRQSLGQTSTILQSGRRGKSFAVTDSLLKGALIQLVRLWLAGADYPAPLSVSALLLSAGSGPDSGSGSGSDSASGSGSGSCGLSRPDPNA